MAKQETASAWIQIRASEADRKRIKREAKRRGVSMSRLMLDLALAAADRGARAARG